MGHLEAGCGPGGEAQWRRKHRRETELAEAARPLGHPGRCQRPSLRAAPGATGPV